MRPDVSLIMPAWRPRSEWLREAVASALDEPDCEVELIVVDDGSEEPVERLLAGVNDARLRPIRVEHAGPYAARNAGVAVAQAAFVRFVDADDVVVAGSTGRLLALAEEEPARIAYGATAICDEDLAPHGVFSSETEGWAAEECVLGRLRGLRRLDPLSPRSVVERAGPWEHGFTVSGDWDFVLRALEQAPVRPLDEIVTRYRRHGASITKRADVGAGAAAGRLVIGRYFERHPEQRGSELERRPIFACTSIVPRRTPGSGSTAPH